MPFETGDKPIILSVPTKSPSSFVCFWLLLSFYFVFLLPNKPFLQAFYRCAIVTYEHVRFFFHRLPSLHVTNIKYGYIFFFLLSNT